MNKKRRFSFNFAWPDTLSADASIRVVVFLDFFIENNSYMIVWTILDDN